MEIAVIMRLAPGQRIDEFEIVRYLSSGAAGDVYVVIAKDNIPKLNIIRGRQYAVKIYKEWVLEEPMQSERIKRELRASQEADSPYIVKIHAVRMDYGRPRRSYLIMEIVNGVTLKTFVSNNRPVSLEAIELIFKQLLEAINALHIQHIIHRDIKPENIMIDSSNKLTLMDLGVVKFELEQTITPSHQFLGTIRYSAPELLFGAAHNATVDLYSAGAILFFLLTGVEPFEDIKMFSELVVRKREQASESLGLQLPTKSQESVRTDAFRIRILRQLVIDLTSKQKGDSDLSTFGRSRPATCAEILAILEDSKIELSDWFLSIYASNDGLTLPDFKSMVIEYLDPRLPLNRKKRIEILKQRKSSYGFHSLRNLLSYLRYIENDEGRKEVEEIQTQMKMQYEEADDVDGD